MMDKETIKEFLKPGWKKFILPLILIILLLHTLNFFHTVGLINDKHECEYFKLIEELNEADLENNTTAFNKTLHTIWLMQDQINHDRTKIKSNLRSNAPIYQTITLIDPLLPVPCELQGLWNHQKPCTDYTSKETYDCITNTVNRIKNTTGGIYIKGYLHLPPTKKCFQDPECNKYATLNLEEMKPHNPPTNQQTLANILLLTLEGYLLTSLIIHIRNKLRKKKIT